MELIGRIQRLRDLCVISCLTQLTTVAISLYVSAPTETETTHTGHERDVDLSVFLMLKSAKIKQCVWPDSS